MIGVLLHQAGLLHPGQIQVVVMEQDVYDGLRFGEIVALHGWLKQETIDFFVQEWHSLLVENPHQPIGYYFMRAHLLTEEQVNQILKEQWQTGYRFGVMAVMNGWLKQETLDFFLNHLVPEAAKVTDKIEKQSLSLAKATHSNNKTTLEQKHQATYVQGGTMVQQQSTFVQKSTLTGGAVSGTVPNIDPEDLADMDQVEVEWLG